MSKRFVALCVLVSIIFFALGYCVEFKTPRDFSTTQPNIQSVDVPDVEYLAPADVSAKRYRTLLIPYDRTVLIRNAIESKESMMIAHSITTLTSYGDPVYLVISSPGGSIVAGRQILEAIEAARGPVYTICISECDSMAALIFQYGKKRIVTPSTILMYHPASVDVSGTLDAVLRDMIFTKKYFDEVELTVAKRLGMTYDEYKYKSHLNIWMQGKDAIKEGFADQIVYIQFN